MVKKGCGCIQYTGCVKWVGDLPFPYGFQTSVSKKLLLVTGLVDVVFANRHLLTSCLSVRLPADGLAEDAAQLLSDFGCVTFTDGKCMA